MSATTSSNESIEGETQSVRDRFEEVMRVSDEHDGDVIVSNRSDTIAAVLDWDAVDESDKYSFTRDTFPETPTGVTRQLLGTIESTPCYVFSSGDNRSYFQKELVLDASEVIGYDLKAHLDELSLAESEDSLLIAEGDDFDMIVAPRMFPD